jgi:hypothetical protein
MPTPDPSRIFDAARISGARTALALGLSTAQMRELGAGIMARSAWTARGTSMIFASKLKEVVDAMAAGDMDEATARVTLLETLRSLQYTPEGGFPDAPPGSVPPAIKGTLQDLSSFRRLNLIVRTQIDLMTGAGDQYRGHTPDRLEAAPAWELIRVLPVGVARDWPGRWVTAGGKPIPESFSKTAHQRMYESTGMIALKGDPVWGELGASANFEDSLDVDHPPFAFNSGMGWREVSRAKCKELGITGPNGESIEEFHAGEDRPRVIAGELPLPTPSLSLKDVPPAFVEKFKADTGAVQNPTNPAVLDFSDLAARSRARRKAEKEAQQTGNLERLTAKERARYQAQEERSRK